jgi:Protein of unknown function (DUF3667)
MTINAPVATDATRLSRWSDRSPDPGLCLNCGTPRTAEYCGTCGQRGIDPHPTVRELLHEVAEELLGWDGKLVRTFRLLIARPGALTLEYLAGRRASFISPLRVYLACSVIAFFVAAVTPDPPARVRSNGTVEQTGQGQIVADQTLQVNLGPSRTNAAGPQSAMGAAIRRSFARAQADKAGLRQKVADAVPKLLFVLVPVLAVLVGLGFRSRTAHYPEHLAFTLHVHAVAFLTLVLPQLATLAHSYRVYRWSLDPSVLIILGYFFLAARRVYGRGIFSTGVRVLVIATLYFFLFYGSLGITSLLFAITY